MTEPIQGAQPDHVTWQQACDAIDSLDDYARMMVGVDPSGPRELLYRFVEQMKKAAEAAEPMDMALCESQRLVLREGQIYRFRRVGACATCAAMSAASLEAYGQPPAIPTPEGAEWSGAVAFIQHAQNAAGSAGADGHWPDEFLRWYKPEDWAGEHRAAAVFMGSKIAALAAQPASSVVSDTAPGFSSGVKAPAEAPEIGEVTWQQAADAIENLDDYARMMVGVDPSGPRETLYLFLEQAKAALANVQPKGTAALELTCSHANRSYCALYDPKASQHRPSAEWYRAKIAETEGLEDFLPCGALAQSMTEDSPAAEVVIDTCADHEGRIEADVFLPAGTKLYTRAAAQAPAPAQRTVPERITDAALKRAMGHPVVLEIMADCVSCADTENDAMSDPEFAVHDSAPYRLVEADLRCQAAAIRAQDPEIWPSLEFAAPAVGAEPEWQAMLYAPRDGSKIELLVEHREYWIALKAGRADGYRQPCEGHWVDFNGGGWSWMGTAGQPIGWRPLRAGTTFDVPVQGSQP